MRLAPGGARLVAVWLAVALLGAIAVHPAAGLLAGALALAMAAFYRDPDRAPPAEGIVAPADGRVHAVEATDDGRLEVVIFLNLWHVHVVRAPWAGRVDRVERVAGHRRPAFLASAAENAGIRLDLDGGRVTMQAGLVARRVRAYVAAGEAVDRGERVGHIAFGSRVAVTLPEGVDREAVRVAVGDRTRAGETRLTADSVA
ncbi:MAG: phosphatidylserine decarboxylase [Halobacteriales archaeon]